MPISDRDAISIAKQKRQDSAKPEIDESVPRKEPIDVIITSASRGDALKCEIESFLECILYSGGFRFHLHEDVVPKMEKDSKKLVTWAVDSGIFDTIEVTDPRKGRGPALNKLRKCAKSKYIFYLEEDWAFIRYVNLDSIIQLLDDNENINQVAFFYLVMLAIPKPGGPDGLNKFKFINEKYGDHYLHVSERWSWCPSVWRKDFIMPLWNFSSVKSGKDLQRRLGKVNICNEWNHDWYRKNIGAYYYGKAGQKPYVYHLCPNVRHDRTFL